MAEPSTFIKIDRNIERWRWYKTPNTLRVFLHLLLNANIADHEFEAITIHRGELATSRASIAAALGLSERNVRTAIEHLKLTGEVSTKNYPKFQVISIVCYDKYQSKASGNASAKRPATDRQASGNRPQLKNGKNLKEGKELFYITPALGRFGNVMLTQEEYDELMAGYDDAEQRIERLSAYMESNGVKYKNHYAKIREWALKDGVMPKETPETISERDRPSY